MNIATQFSVVVKNKKGTHAIQKLIDLTTSDREISFMMALIQDHVVEYSIDP